MATLVLPHTATGDPDGMPIIMVHPLGADRTFWDGCSPHFGPGVLSIACDLRGSGVAPLPSSPLTLEQTIADLDTLRRHLGASRLLLMGCAAGAMAAALYAATFPGQVAGLVLSNPGVRIAAAASANLRQRAELARAHGMSALLPTVTDNAFFGQSKTDLRERFDRRFLAESAEGYALAVLGVCGADIAPQLPRIGCPVLLVSGRNDKLMPVRNAEEIMGAVPAATAVEFEDGAHFIPYQQPRQFGETVAAFLDRQDLRRR